ncbi:MAG: cache domain-containing protein [Planctomycetota bacterium]|jgi:C4-dicarboxylate-specific signal transduction histidine kinase
MSRRISLVILLALSMTAACAGTSKEEEAPEPDPALDQARAAKIADELDQALMRGYVACRALSENAHVRAFCDTRENPHKVLAVLRDVVTRSGADRASLLDSGGVVIASTDLEAVGYDFRHSGFFKAAQEDQVVIFPSVGFVNERRGLFVVVPQGAPGARGAAVLRMSVGSLDRSLETLRKPAALIYRDRYVLATNRPQWGFHGHRDLEERGQTLDLSERDLQKMLDSVVPPIGETVEWKGLTYQVNRYPMFLEDWQMVVCVPQVGSA